MQKKLIYLGCAFIFIFNQYLSAQLNKIIDIGSNDPDYLFMHISGATVDENRNIYVCDSKGSFLRKYDSTGKFIKEIGRRGEGPGEFSNSLKSLLIDENLYLLDSLNHRIVEVDCDLNIKRYINLKELAISFDKMDDKFYLVRRKAGEPFMEVAVYDINGKFIMKFFDFCPPYLPEKPRSKSEYATMLSHSEIVLATNKEKKEIAASFARPDKYIEVYFFDRNGQFQRSIRANHVEDYHFESFWLSFPPKYPAQSKLIGISTIKYIDEQKILLEYWVSKLNYQQIIKEDEYLLIIDTKTGNVIHKEILVPKIRILDAKKDLLIAASIDEEIPKLLLYRINY